MDIKNWVIVTDERRLNGMLHAVKQLGEPVGVVVLGVRSLADAVAMAGFDRLLWYPVEPDTTPVEMYATGLAEAMQASSAKLVLSSETPASRVLLGAVAAKLNASIVSSVRALENSGSSIVVKRATVEGKVVETLEVTGVIACIFDGDDAEQNSGSPSNVEEVAIVPNGVSHIVETSQGGADIAGLLNARRVVGMGLGVRAKDDLHLIEELATALHAELACSLGICDDMRWFDASRVVGSSHSQISPDLYVAVGISGQPQHMSGVRDAKVIVAINNDPEARVFKNCSYGIVGDLYKVVPALAAALKAVE